MTCQVGLSSLISCYVQWFGIYFTRSYGKGLAICFFREKDNVQSGSRSQEKVKVSRSSHYFTEGMLGPKLAGHAFWVDIPVERCPPLSHRSVSL